MWLEAAAAVVPVDLAAENLYHQGDPFEVCNITCNNNISKVYSSFKFENVFH